MIKRIITEFCEKISNLEVVTSSIDGELTAQLGECKENCIQILSNENASEISSSFKSELSVLSGLILEIRNITGHLPRIQNICDKLDKNISDSQLILKLFGELS